MHVHVSVAVGGTIWLVGTQWLKGTDMAIFELRKKSFLDVKAMDTRPYNLHTYVISRKGFNLGRKTQGTLNSDGTSACC